MSLLEPLNIQKAFVKNILDIATFMLFRPLVCKIVNLRSSIFLLTNMSLNLHKRTLLPSKK